MTDVRIHFSIDDERGRTRRRAAWPRLVGAGLLGGLSICLLVACIIEGPTIDYGSGGSATTSSTTSGTGVGGQMTTTTTTTTTTSTTTTVDPCPNGPLANPIPNCKPPVPPSTGDFGQDCVDRINQFRWECQCLPPLQRWTQAESCTDTQSQNDQQTGQAHGNFGACGENAQNTCPNWGSEKQVIDGCLQMMWDEGPGEPFSAHGHYLNMSSTQFSKVACGRFSSSKGVWSNQNFKP